jgi:DMSO reductase anchor subunit
MKYFGTFKWFFIVGGLVIVFNMITSPDAFTAGERSAGIVAMLFGVFIVWTVMELFALGKKEPDANDEKKE